MSGPLYEIDKPYRGERRKRDRLGALALIIIFLILLGAVIWIVFDVLHLRNPIIKKSIGKTTHVQIAEPQIYRNGYFQFSDTAKWVNATKKNSTVFVYFLYASGVPAHSVTVYANQSPSPVDVGTSRVMPVQIKNGNSFTTGEISDFCGKLFKPTDPKRQKLVSLSGTSMQCVPDTTEYTVIVGQIGGDYNLTLKRADGTTAHYVIMYHNLSISPDPAPFERIMKTFQAL